MVSTTIQLVVHTKHLKNLTTITTNLIYNTEIQSKYINFLLFKAKYKFQTQLINCLCTLLAHLF